MADPETKRKIIGKEFIDVFAEEAKKLNGIDFLAQGTIYPDILESGPIKSHHNVGRVCPKTCTSSWSSRSSSCIRMKSASSARPSVCPTTWSSGSRSPAPASASAASVPSRATGLEAVRESDAILREEFAKNGLEGKVWQYFTIVPDFKSTGVTNGQRTYDWPVVIRAVNTVDAVTADVAELSFKMMQYIVDRITHEVPGVNRVLWDLTPKPTGTIEWE